MGETRKAALLVPHVHVALPWVTLPRPRVAARAGQAAFGGLEEPVRAPPGPN
jgi:hypothetical protein